MKRRVVILTSALVVVLAGAGIAGAQNWTGGYLGGSIGGGLQRTNATETVRFDTNLDGTFADAVRTVAGADAFTPGFCGGLAAGPTPAAGCADDDGGIDIGGRIGYDRQFGRFVVGGLADVARIDVTDSVTAFSTTPAFYSFTRRMQSVAGFRGRAGLGLDRVLVYGTAGGAWGRIEQRFTTSNTVNTFVRANGGGSSNDDDGPTENVWGYQAGGGLEVAVGSRWSLTGEYLFTSFDNRDVSTIRAQGPAPATNPFVLVNPAGTDLRRVEAFSFQAVRAGLSYRF
jgi:outer membrane immunogenic protein